jgi:hypothetical protein
MEIPKPELGMVVSIEYQWLHENAKGLINGLKDRPAVVVLISDTNHISVAPITSTAPGDLSAAIEIPPKVLRHLGLDDKPTWIICDEVNEFVWPGYDLRPLDKNPETCVYNFLPPALFNQVIGKIQFIAQGKKLSVVNRDD